VLRGGPDTVALLESELSPPARESGVGSKTSRFPSRAEYERGVVACKELIRRGDAFQIVLSQRAERRTGVSALALYRSLRLVNPSPYLFLLELDGIALVGSSPETLVKCDGGRASVNPIAGSTRPGEGDAERLLASEKDRAEHVMLVDLGRNDVGRVCEYGSVRVPQFMGLERFSHVMHLTSVVEGRLADRCDRIDALVSCFPAGTVSGAPKVRAMQIIRTLEPSGRGIYAGAVGYLDFAGNLDFCIAIRTIIMSAGKAFIQAGAGIVMDSNPTAEYEETRDKMRALVGALELAQQGL
jgi:anthranilate synthase component 1